jgi:superfamily I DNA/RNA helicase
MDAIEVARRRAASIHAAALARGSDPWSPFAFVLDEVERAGFAAEPIEPGAVQLDGALAKFLPDIGLILYSDVDSAFERAFLIAHELGHALLGDAIDICEFDPDGQADVDADDDARVIAHGPRQRREIQMDLFARELLLPRPFLKVCHLADGLGAAAIAERVGAPYDLVAQQMLDALLVPVAPEDVSRPVRKLNAAQRDAAEHFGGAYLLEAGPGTGKTETLVGRVSWLLAHQRVLPREILVLTYSNNAAAQLSDRIAGGNVDALAEMWIGTFHAFGRDLLNVFGDRVGRTRTPGFVDRVGAIDLLEHELASLDLRHFRDLYDPTTCIDEALTAIARAQDELCGPERYRALATEQLARARALAGELAGGADGGVENGGASERAAENVIESGSAADSGSPTGASEDASRAAAIDEAEKACDIAAIYERYVALKIAHSLVDFGDYVMLAVELLDQHEDARSYARRYRQILVDEYQDVNQASVALLKALCPAGAGLWAVGDARQSIYRFRGASSRNIARFGLDFPGATVGALVLSYRSRPEIVSLVSHFGKSMTPVVGDGDPPPQRYEALGTTRGPCGVKPELVCFPTTAEEAPALAETITASVRDGARYSDHCVLVSGNDRLERIARDLEALEVPVLFLGSFFQRSEVKALLNLASLLVDPGASGIMRAATHQAFSMSLADAMLVLGTVRSADTPAGAWIDAPLDYVDGVSDEGRASFTALADMLRPLERNGRPSRILAEILLDRTRMAARLAQREDVAGITAGLATWQLINFARSQRGAPGRSITQLILRIRRLLQLGEARDYRQLPAAAQTIDAVRLMTIHAAKGLEFDQVHLLGLNADTLPKRDRKRGFVAPDGMVAFPRGSLDDELDASHQEEQECLFYVALSRAGERLLLYRAEADKRGGAREESAFVARLAPHLATRRLVPTQALPAAADAQPVPVTLASNWTVPAWQLDMYKSCKRRFLYVHLLRVGGAQHRTALRRVHDAVHRVCDDLASRDALPPQAEIDALVTAAIAHPEIANHGNAAGLGDLARQLVARYCAARLGMTRIAPQSFDTTLGGDTVVARPHEILDGPGGKVIRLLKTGHCDDDDCDSLEARAVALGALSRFPGVPVELLYLADDADPVPITLKKAPQTYFDKAVGKALTSIRAGDFAPAPRASRCAVCPAFLQCEALPGGSLALSA